VAAPPSAELGLLFPNGRGRVEGYPNIWKRLWTPLMRTAGLVDLARRPAFGLHTLRHVAVSLWIEQGATPKWVSVKAGHHSIQFTLDTYGHLWPKPDEDAAVAAAAERSVFGV
jgi:integrase